MQVTPVMEPLGDVQIGGGTGWVADRVRDGLMDARTALALAQRDWTKPAIGLHPREAALAAAREAVAHLAEALEVEAPEDAVQVTRHALEELGTAILVLERMHGKPPVAPGEKPTGHFEGAIKLLEQVETRLRTTTVGFG
jgi:hypothetical protein